MSSIGFTEWVDRRGISSVHAMGGYNYICVLYINYCADGGCKIISYLYSFQSCCFGTRIYTQHKKRNQVTKFFRQLLNSGEVPVFGQNLFQKKCSHKSLVVELEARPTVRSGARHHRSPGGRQPGDQLESHHPHCEPEQRQRHKGNQGFFMNAIKPLKST